PWSRTGWKPVLQLWSPLFGGHRLARFLRHRITHLTDHGGLRRRLHARDHRLRLMALLRLRHLIRLLRDLLRGFAALAMVRRQAALAADFGHVLAVATHFFTAFA